MEEFLRKVRKLLPAPRKLAEAVDAALAAGCTLAQLRERARWFQAHEREWPPQHRPGVLYYGFLDATPELAADQGWCYR